jgi:hypothetical protein
VQKINQSSTWTAELLSQDMSAVILCKQTNAAVGMPYECVVSEVGLLGLLEPSLPAVAATPSGSLAYQVREYLQAFIERDRNYRTRCFSAGKRNSHARARERRGIVAREYHRAETDPGNGFLLRRGTGGDLEYSE